MQKIIPNLWFDSNGQDAVDFYISIFPDSAIKNTAYYGKTAASQLKKKEGGVMIVTFDILGQEFTIINGGPNFTFSPAISLLINCETQDEIDYYWNKLSDGGGTDMCGWIRDRFGVSWQVVPAILERYLSDEDEAKREAVFEVMLTMKKLEIAVLENAYNGAA